MIMFFSAIVPVYNVEKYLRQCLDSLVNQTCTDRELIIVDDGSTDSSGAICDEYAKYPNTTIIHQENCGLSAARNAGLERATGEWLLFVDSDDWVDIDMLERLQAYILATDADLYRFNDVITNEDGSTEKENNIITKDTFFSLPDEQSRFDYYHRYTTSVCCVWQRVYRHSIILEHNLRFVDEKMVYAEDRLFNFQYMLHAHSVLWMNFSPYHYRIRTDSLAHSTPPALKLTRAFRLMEYAYHAVVNAGFAYYQTHFYKLYFNIINFYITNKVADLDPPQVRPIIREACRKEFHRSNFREIRRHGEIYERRTRGRVWYAKGFGRRRSQLGWLLWLFWQNLKYKRRHETLETINYDRDEEHLVAYLSNAKAACSSIRVSMTRRDDIPDDYSVFATKKVLSLQKPFKDSSWFTFSFVRNPFARLVSCYESKYHEDRTRNSLALRRGFQDFDFYLDGYMKEDKGFEHFVHQVLSIPNRLANAHFRSQYHLLVDKDGKPVVDFIGRVENIEVDYEPIRQKYGFAPLRHYNKANYGDWRDYYTTRLAKRVYRKYKKDVLYFGYEEEYRKLLEYCREKEQGATSQASKT